MVNFLSIFCKPEVHEFESGWEVSIIPDPHDASMNEVGTLFKHKWTSPPIEFDNSGIRFSGGIANFLTRVQVDEIVKAVSELE